jgi:hypothetical protein
VNRRLATVSFFCKLRLDKNIDSLDVQPVSNIYDQMHTNIIKNNKSKGKG